MKTKIYSLLIGGMMVATSCSDFTDVKPKGVNMLEKATELEMLLNQEYYGKNNSDLDNMGGSMIYALENVPTIINQAQDSRSSIIWGFKDDRMNRLADLTASDADYEFFCGNVGRIANPILSKVDASEGDPATKAKIKGEAYIMRAWSEYMLVNKFAKAYNPSTAATDGGVPYMPEDWDITVPTEQFTMAEVYDKLLADIDAAIATGGLPQKPVNKCRFGLGAAYALKTLVLLNKQDWDGTIAAADQALAINSTVTDYWSAEHTKITIGYMLGGQYECFGRPRLTCDEDYFCTDGYLLGAITTEFKDKVEPGCYVLSRLGTLDMMYDYLMSGAQGFGLGIDVTAFLYDFDYGWNYFGFRTSQMYLAKAEALIHKGKYEEAMQNIDIVRAKRIDPQVYAPLAGTGVGSEADAMFHLKRISHADNFHSAYEFINQKRWNAISGWEDTITHDFCGVTYTLRPDSKLWIFPFPKNAVNFNPNLKQNYAQ